MSEPQDAAGHATGTRTPPLAALLGIAAAEAPPCDCSGEVSDAVAAAAAAARATALAEADARWSAELEALRAIAATERAAAEARAEALVAAATDALADLLLMALRAVLGTMRALPPEAAQSLAAEAIAAFAERGTGTLRVAPSALEAVRGSLPEGWMALADESVPPGAAEASLGPAIAHASIAHRLETLARGLSPGDEG